MPSASSKPDKPTPVGVEEPLKQAIGLIEKKARNLEKRKGKLDDIRARKASGKKLEKDQEEAIANYDVVDKNLAFAKEMITQFTQLETEIEKLARKQAKRDRIERQAAEAARCKALLVLQSTLDNMGAEEVREHFINGTNGAVKVSEEKLDHLDELYKLINPSRETAENFEDELKAAAEHLACYLEPRDKEVLGTNYKDLRALVDSIHESGYFDKKDEEEVVNGEAEEEAVEEPAAEPDTNEAAYEEAVEAPVSEEPVQVAEVSESHVTEPVAPAAPVAEVPQAPAGYSEAEAASYYSTAPYARRDFQEIVSSVKGTYSFLQDSHIDEHDSLHQDPAVLAAAMPIRTNLTAQAEQPPATTLTFQNSNYLAEEAQHAQKSHTQDSFHSTQYQQQSYSSAMEPPAAIPMPNDAQDKNAPASAPQGPGFTMNPNAAMFQPNMYEQQQQAAPAGGQAEQPPAPQQPIPAQPTKEHINHEVMDGEDEEGYEQDQQQGEFQGWGNYRNGRGGGRGRGRGGNMSNGYSRGGRGNSQNGGYRGENQRGGYREGGNRGGYRQGGNSNYQGGYQQRDNYKSDGYQGGYQNGGGNYNNQRGGRGKPQGGAPRDGGYRGGRGGQQSGGRGGYRGQNQGQGQQRQQQGQGQAAM